VLREINAAHGKELKGALRDFDAALCGHVGFVLSNAVRSLLFGLFDGRGISVPPVENDRYYQRLTRYSAAFALAADAAMLMLGGSLKRREMISARLGDVLSQLYLGSALLKRFEDEGRPQEDLPLLRWAMQDALYKIETALDGVLQNFPSRVAAFVLRRLIFPLGRRVRVPSDKLGHEAASLLLKPGATRDRLTAGMYLPAEKDDPIGALEAALHSALECEPLYAKMETARKARKIGGKALQEAQRVAEAREKGILSAEEAELLERDLALQRKVIMVDDFAPAQLVRAAAEASPGTP
jgi:acyl-CoA dehydrogenase